MSAVAFGGIGRGLGRGLDVTARDAYAPVALGAVEVSERGATGIALE